EVTSGGLRADDPAYGNSGLPVMVGFCKTLDLGKYTESYQVIYHSEVEYRSLED
ncbi:hypothetical protein PIB30_104633, partial [Stylosanthes scabra]|nr:hypothetical protein [Stylosanthes scabra]